MFRLIIKGIFFGLIFFMLFAGCRQTRNTGGTINNTAEDTPENNNLTETTVIAEETTANSVNIKSDPRLSTFKMVSTGRWFGYTLAIKTDGSLWSWGYNRHGQLGDGTREDRLSPVRIGADYDWASVSASSSHSVALKTDGSLWAWGYNDSGLLGDGTAENRLSPVRIGADNDWASVSAGDSFTVAIKTDGSMWSWGSNIDAKLGNGTTGGFKNTPTRIGADNDWSFVSAGDWQAVSIKTDGSLWEWGWIMGGPNGSGERFRLATVTRPTRVGTETNWAAASAGTFGYRIAIKADGTLWTWGEKNLLSQIGKDNFNSLVQIGTDTDWLSVSANIDNTMAIKTDGSLWAWGTLGEYPEISDDFEPLLEYGNIPVRIWGDTKWAYISASSWHAFAIMTDGSLWAWGKRRSYTDGMLGDGTTTDRLSPVQIGFAEESGIK